MVTKNDVWKKWSCLVFTHLITAHAYHCLLVNMKCLIPKSYHFKKYYPSELHKAASDKTNPSTVFILACKDLTKVDIWVDVAFWNLTSAFTQTNRYLDNQLYRQYANYTVYETPQHGCVLKSQILHKQPVNDFIMPCWCCTILKKVHVTLKN